VPGTGIWGDEGGAPATLNGGAQMVAQYFDGSNNILVFAMGNSGLWKYREP
jgi:hypothetical protein